MYIIRVHFPDGWLWVSQRGHTTYPRTAKRFRSTKFALNNLVEHAEYYRSVGASTFSIEKTEA